MGVFEMSKFEAGTKGIMDAVVAATKAGTVSIIGESQLHYVTKAQVRFVSNLFNLFIFFFRFLLEFVSQFVTDN